LRNFPAGCGFGTRRDVTRINRNDSADGGITR
jgi:hypothetical protein